jgi:hypothetical protein
MPLALRPNEKSSRTLVGNRVCDGVGEVVGVPVSLEVGVALRLGVAEVVGVGGGISHCAATPLPINVLGLLQRQLRTAPVTVVAKFALHMHADEFGGDVAPCGQTLHEGAGPAPVRYELFAQMQLVLPLADAEMALTGHAAHAGAPEAAA